MQTLVSTPPVRLLQATLTLGSRRGYMKNRRPLCKNRRRLATRSLRQALLAAPPRRRAARPVEHTLAWRRQRRPLSDRVGWRRREGWVCAFATDMLLVLPLFFLAPNVTAEKEKFNRRYRFDIVLRYVPDSEVMRLVSTGLPHLHYIVSMLGGEKPAPLLSRMQTTGWLAILTRYLPTTLFLWASGASAGGPRGPPTQSQ